MRNWEYYMERAEAAGGTNDSRIDVVWSTFTTKSSATAFFNFLIDEGVPLYRNSVIEKDGDYKVAWYKS